MFQIYDGIHYLIIPNCRPSDAGEIVAIAKNTEGEAMSTGSLDVFVNHDFRFQTLKPASMMTEDEKQNRETEWNTVRDYVRS